MKYSKIIEILILFTLFSLLLTLLTLTSNATFNRSSLTPPSIAVQKKLDDIKNDTAPAPTSAPTTVTSTPQGSTQNSASTKPKTTAIPTPGQKTINPQTVLFSVSGLQSAYSFCNYDGVGYMIGSTNIYTNQVTSKDFTWHIELNNGDKTDSLISTMPNSMTWFNFPSTSEYPRMLGSLSNARDGDSIRFVITSPNYSASPWSQPVPAGTQESCGSTTVGDRYWDLLI